MHVANYHQIFASVSVDYSEHCQNNAVHGKTSCWLGVNVVSLEWIPGQKGFQLCRFVCMFISFVELLL